MIYLIVYFAVLIAIQIFLAYNGEGMDAAFIALFWPILAVFCAICLPYFLVRYWRRFK